MKKKILLCTAVAGMAAAILTSGKNGAGAEKGYDCTGAETGLGNSSGCATVAGCHGGSANSGLTLLLTLDSAGGVSTTHYIAGMTYTVTITGTNTTATTYDTFGFQVSCIEGSIAATTPNNAGTFQATGLPAHVRYTAAPGSPDFVCNVIEHNDPIPATTGTGGTGTTYAASFTWTAPVGGTGVVSFWGAMNIAPGGADTGVSTGTIWNTTKLIVADWHATGIANVVNQISVTAFPNPVINNLSLQMDNAQPGIYSLEVFDINGKIVTTENIAVNATSHTSTINASNWTPGTYHVVVEKDGSRQMIPVVKL